MKYFRLILRIASASVWFAYGFVGKVLGLVPRHKFIVGRLLGDDMAGLTTPILGILEILLSLWILSGKESKACAATQTISIIMMNTLELIFARDLLLSPVAMVLFNAGLIAVAWYLASIKPVSSIDRNWRAD